MTIKFLRHIHFCSFQKKTEEFLSHSKHHEWGERGVSGSLNIYGLADIAIVG